MKKSVTAEQETEHSAEELADGVIAHAEVGIDGAVAGLGSGRPLCAAGDADAILVVAGDVCGNNCTAVSADNVVSAVAVVHILPVVFHVVAGVLSTASAGALAVLTVNTLSSFRHNCTALSADDLVSAVAVVLVLEGAVGAGVAADTGAGLKNAGHISVIDGAALVDSVNVMMRSIDHGVGSANFLRLGSAADASAVAVIAVDAGGGLGHNCIAVSADDLVGAIAIVLVLEGAVRAGVATDTGAGLKNAGCNLIIGDLAVLIDSVNTVMGCIDRNISGAGFFNRLCSFFVSTDTESTGFGTNVSTLSIILKSARHIVRPDYPSAVSLVMDNIMMSRISGLILGMFALGCSSESSRSHGQNHCACQHGGQKAAELFQFHKTDLLYTTKFLILPRAASQFIHAWTAGTSHFRNILRVVQWFTLGLPLL